MTFYLSIITIRTVYKDTLADTSQWNCGENQVNRVCMCASLFFTQSRTRREYIEILRELRRRKPDADMATLESMAAAEVLNRGPKSRAYYRIQATRKLTGGGNLIKRKTAAADRRESLADGLSTGPDEDVTRVFFDPGQYTVFENVGTFVLTVVRQVDL